MSQITGKCIIRLNGSELQSTDDATLNVGGVNREAVVGGGKVYGYKEETVAPTLECSVAHDKKYGSGGPFGHHGCHHHL